MKFVVSFVEINSYKISLTLFLVLWSHILVNKADIGMVQNWVVVTNVHKQTLQKEERTFVTQTFQLYGKRDINPAYKQNVCLWKSVDKTLTSMTIDSFYV